MKERTSREKNNDEKKSHLVIYTLLRYKKKKLKYLWLYVYNSHRWIVLVHPSPLRPLFPPLPVLQGKTDS